MLTLAVMAARAAMQPPRKSVGWAMVRRLPTEPGDLDLRATAFDIHRPDGVQLPVWQIAMTTNDDESDTDCGILFVHHYASSRIELLPILRRWTQLDGDPAIIAFDRRGHGESVGNRAGLASHQEIHDLFAVLESIHCHRLAIVAMHDAVHIVIPAIKKFHSTTDMTPGGTAIFVAGHWETEPIKLARHSLQYRGLPHWPLRLARPLLSRASSHYISIDHVLRDSVLEGVMISELPTLSANVRAQLQSPESLAMVEEWLAQS